MQSNEKEKNIINKICNYILEFYFDLDEDSNDENFNQECNDVISDNEGNISKEHEENYLLSFDEFYPKKIPKIKKNVRKRNYNQLIGEENELNKFWDLINLNK